VSTNMSHDAEVTVLLACLRGQGKAKGQDQLEPLLERVDFERLLSLAYHHAVIPLLYQQLKQLSSNAVPAEVLDRTRRHYERNGERNRILADELVRLLKLFKSQGIPTIPYKGVEMAHMVYGDIALRQFNDIDFLIRSKDLPRVCELLYEEGYESSHQQMAPRFRKRHEQEEKEYQFMRWSIPGHGGPIPHQQSPNDPNNSALIVEPHWRITPRRRACRIDYDRLWERTRHVEFLGEQILVLAPEDLILAMCMCGKWGQLRAVCDLAQLVKTFSAMDWENCVESACRTGVERIFLVVIVLSNELLSAPVPGQLLERTASDSTVQEIAKKLRYDLFHDPTSKTTPHWQFARFQMQLRERLRDKILYCILTVTSPREVHFKRIPLPLGLVFLYRFIVPIYDYLFKPIQRSIEAIRRPGDH